MRWVIAFTLTCVTIGAPGSAVAFAEQQSAAWGTTVQEVPAAATARPGSAEAALRGTAVDSGKKEESTEEITRKLDNPVADLWSLTFRLPHEGP